MGYEDEMKALLHNCIGGFSREVLEIYWTQYQQTALQNQLMNLYVKFA